LGSLPKIAVLVTASKIGPPLCPLQEHLCKTEISPELRTPIKSAKFLIEKINQ
jgi:hypothetical protein